MANLNDRDELQVIFWDVEERTGFYQELIEILPSPRSLKIDWTDNDPIRAATVVKSLSRTRSLSGSLLRCDWLLRINNEHDLRCYAWQEIEELCTRCADLRQVGLVSPKLTVNSNQGYGSLDSTEYCKYLIRAEGLNLQSCSTVVSAM